MGFDKGVGEGYTFTGLGARFGAVSADETDEHGLREEMQRRRRRAALQDGTQRRDAAATLERRRRRTMEISGKWQGAACHYNTSIWRTFCDRHDNVLPDSI